jgi:hypothetical protein
MLVLARAAGEPFRIFEDGDQHEAVVAIHGWITEPAVGEVVKVVARKGPGVRIDLSQLVGVDHAGLVQFTLHRAAARIAPPAMPQESHLEAKSLALLSLVERAIQDRSPGAARRLLEYSDQLRSNVRDLAALRETGHETPA